jgi:protein-S-isoprenylcysteine O-methyltransferase Ste14
MGLLFVFFKVCPLLLICLHAFFESYTVYKYARPEAGPSSETQAYSLLWLLSCLSFFFYELAVAYKELSFPAVTPLLAAGSALGIALFICGVFLRLSAIRELKAAFGTPAWAAKGVSLTARGVFTWVRHPSELGLALMCLGLALAGNALAIFGAFAFVLLPLMLLRIRQEERWLMRQTQGAYAGYAATVPGLFPISRRAGRMPKMPPDGQEMELGQGSASCAPDRG